MPRPAIGSNSPCALELAPGLDPWQQQPGESDGAYGRFTAFLQLHPVQRKDPRRVFEELQRRGDTTATTPATIANQATLNQWRTRARAWDAYCRRRQEEALQIAAQKWADLLARRRVQAEFDHLDASDKFRKKALEIIEAKAVDDASFAEAARLMEQAYKMARETLRLVQPTGQGAAPSHVNDLSDDQTSARLRELADELARRMNNQPTSAAAAAPDVMDAEVISPESSDHDDAANPADPAELLEPDATDATDATGGWTGEWSDEWPDDPADDSADDSSDGSWAGPDDGPYDGFGDGLTDAPEADDRTHVWPDHAGRERRALPPGPPPAEH